MNKEEIIERLNKDLQTAIDICNNRQKEIVRLNNIIVELNNKITKLEAKELEYLDIINKMKLEKEALDNESN